MNQLEKLIARLKAGSASADYSDVRRLLEAFGWTVDRHRGSHVSFKRGRDDGTITIALVSGRRVKRTYVMLILERLDI